MVTKNNGAADYCNKEDTRLSGPWSHGVRPARLDKKGDKARRNKDLISMGAEQAVTQGIIDIKDYPKVKNAIDLFTNCTATCPDLDSELHDANTWLYGKPGVGKTKRARSENPGYYDKDKTKYWNGYTN